MKRTLLAFLLLTGLGCIEVDAGGPVRRAIVGDSNTVGFPGPRELAYPHLLMALYDNIYEYGRGGAGVSHWLPESGWGFYETVADEGPFEEVWIMLGTWEAFDEVPPAVYHDRLARLVSLLLEDGTADTVVLMPVLQVARDRDDFSNGLILEYREEAFSICAAQTRVICGPDVALEVLPAAFIGPDGLHLNAAGHERIASLIVEFIGARQ